MGEEWQLGNGAYHHEHELTVWKRYIHSEETLTIPEGVKVGIKTRTVTVEGPRGKLVKNLGHLAVSFKHAGKNVIKIELHHGNRKNVATLVR